MIKRNRLIPTVHFDSRGIGRDLVVISACVVVFLLLKLWI